MVHIKEETVNIWEYKDGNNDNCKKKPLTWETRVITSGLTTWRWIIALHVQTFCISIYISVETYRDLSYDEQNHLCFYYSPSTMWRRKCFQLWLSVSQSFSLQQRVPNIQRPAPPSILYRTPYPLYLECWHVQTCLTLTSLYWTVGKRTGRIKVKCLLVTKMPA